MGWSRGEPLNDGRCGVAWFGVVCGCVGWCRGVVDQFNHVSLYFLRSFRFTSADHRALLQVSQQHQQQTARKFYLPPLPFLPPSIRHIGPSVPLVSYVIIPVFLLSSPANIGPATLLSWPQRSAVQSISNVHRAVHGFLISRSQIDYSTALNSIFIFRLFGFFIFFFFSESRTTYFPSSRLGRASFFFPSASLSVSSSSQQLFCFPHIIPSAIPYCARFLIFFPCASLRHLLLRCVAMTFHISFSRSDFRSLFFLTAQLPILCFFLRSHTCAKDRISSNPLFCLYLSIFLSSLSLSVARSYPSSSRSQ